MLAWNLDPPDLCLLSSQDYRREPLAPGFAKSYSNCNPSAGDTRQKLYTRPYAGLCVSILLVLLTSPKGRDCTYSYVSGA
jgi:hypothetical protein